MEYNECLSKPEESKDAKEKYTENKKGLFSKLVPSIIDFLKDDNIKDEDYLKR
jgi:hypothetical protein